MSDKPYNQRDHRHCYNDQEGHQTHLKCCLCLLPSVMANTKLPDNVKVAHAKPDVEGYPDGYFIGFELGRATVVKEVEEVLKTYGVNTPHMDSPVLNRQEFVHLISKLKS